MIPTEEAMQEYKEKITMQLEPLRQQLEDLLEFKSAEEKKAEELRSETEIHRQKVVSLFEELQQFLKKEKQILLWRLEEEEKKILQRIRENVSQLEQQSSSLKQLISEMEEKSQQLLTQLISETEEKSQHLDSELLKDMNKALGRDKEGKFPEPEAVSADLKMNFELSYPHRLKKLVKNFGGLDWWMDCGRYAVDVTLDPETAHQKLYLSADFKSVSLGKRQNLVDNLKRFVNDCCVLGCESFTLGRHYWEVKVRGVTHWKLGVCKDSVERKGYIIQSPETGFWAVQLQDGTYSALTSCKTLLSLTERLCIVGIFLDYEAGKVSFYNADNKSHLFTFTDTFTGKLRPFFYTYSIDPLKIQLVSAKKWESQAQN